MKTKASAPLLLAVAGALAVGGCSAKADGEEQAQRAPAAAAAVRVKVVQGKELMSAPTEEATGALNPARALPLGFEVGGRLSHVRVKKGERVKAGQVLAELDTEIARAQVAQARAAMAAAKAGFGMASDVAARNDKLRAEGSVSELQHRGATTQSQQAEAQLLAARAQLAQAEAALRRHTLTAPFDGTLIMAPEQPGATVGPGTPLFMLEQLDSLLLVTTVSQQSRALLSVGAKVKVEAVGGDTATALATVRTIIPSADPVTRRVPVDIVVPNPDGAFVAHTLARVTLVLGEEAPAVALPASTLDASGGDHVFAVADGKAHRVDVEVLRRTPTEVVVRAKEPLRDVVDHPAAELTDGATVTVK